jgi:hypothetical protein
MADSQPSQAKPNIDKKSQINSVIKNVQMTDDIHPMLAPLNKICILTVQQGIGTAADLLVKLIPLTLEGPKPSANTDHFTPIAAAQPHLKEPC